MLEGVPGAVRPGEDAPPPDSYPAPTDVAIDSLIQKEGSTETLVSLRPRHVMIHLSLRLNEGKDDLVYDQLVSDVTKQQFISDGKDPREISRWLQENYDDMMILFARMPAAELSPGVIMEPAGRNQFRLKLTGTMGRGIRFNELWVQKVGRSWKFVWVK